MQSRHAPVCQPTDQNMLYSVITIGALLLAAYSLMVLECFLPTSGLLAIFSIVCLMSAIFSGFSINLTAGFSVILVVTVVTPSVIVMLVRFWPMTTTGKKILNFQPETARQTKKKKRINRSTTEYGVTTTDLTPHGLATISGNETHVVSHGEFIPKNSKIIVTKKEMKRLYVREVEQSVTTGDPAAGPRNMLTSFDQLG